MILKTKTTAGNRTTIIHWWKTSNWNKRRSNFHNQSVILRLLSIEFLRKIILN